MIEISYSLNHYSKDPTRYIVFASVSTCIEKSELSHLYCIEYI